MNTSVAVGLEGDNFSKSLQRLTQELGITGNDLVMLMSGPVAVRLVDASIAKPLQWLDPEFGTPGKDLVTFMSDYATVKLEGASRRPQGEALDAAP